MCGIVGYVGGNNALPYLLNGLKKLEYRGYDSSGVVIENSNDNNHALTLYKKAGKLSALIDTIPKEIPGTCGLGHTRWATHGAVTDTNAHPFLSSDKSIAIVHNGIIENFMDLRTQLTAEGFTFSSDTDSEVFANLIQKYYSSDLMTAVKMALKDVIGTYALAVTSTRDAGKIVVARRGGPVVIGLGTQEYYVASDINAIAGSTRRVIYLTDGDIVELSTGGIRFCDVENFDYAKRVEEITIEARDTEKGNFDTYMEKEIFEQVDSSRRAMAGRLDKENNNSRMSGFTSDIFSTANRVCALSAGTSYYASIVGSYLIEKYARVPCVTDVSSEVRYKNPIVNAGDVYLTISQSGETADTITAMREIQEKGGKVFGICNVISSTIARETSGGAFIHAGPEIAVASTKAFINTLVVYYLLTLKMARARAMSSNDGAKFISAIENIPNTITNVLNQKDKIRDIAQKYCHAHDFLFLGRGILYPIALEGALKLKEISYIHAEGFAAGEIKHGPIAMVNSETPSVFFVDDSYLREKTISNIKEVKARGGKVIVIGVESDNQVMNLADDFIGVQKVSNSDFYAIPMAVVAQLFAYYCARALNRDVDQPRNLAKSVTVE